MANINDCRKIQPLLSLYMDGMLEAGRAWDVKLHIASCRVCTRAAQDLTATVALLQALPRQDTSASFEDALARRLADQVLQQRRPSPAERAREWWALPRLRPALAAAGALAVLVPCTLVLNVGQHKVKPAVSVSAATSADPFVDQCLEEHALDATAEPLGDQTAVLLASSSPFDEDK